ncbi:hypothetical protein [Lonepinella sp. BR2474]|uniref:hypothetical protein n=1 Tax=Lonepinella sp. BR2474 TaxID=3434548 RepID=UPI003F6E3229
MKKLLILTAVVTALSGCVSTELSTQTQSYDASQNARIRLYGQNGKPSTLEVVINGKTEKISVGGGFGQALSSMVGAKGNESIGMPDTPLSKNPSAYDKGLVSSIFFKEFVIPVGKTTVNNSITPMTNTSIGYNTGLDGSITKTTTIMTTVGCTGNSVTFNAEAGKDYEVAPFTSGSDCGVTVYEIK